MAARRSLLLLLLAVALVVPLAGPAAAHDPEANAERVGLAEPATEGEGKATEFVANLQYGLLPGGATFQAGSDIEFMTLGEKDYALAGTLRNGMQIVDITDPSAPTIAGVYECPITQGDIQVFRQGERVLATYTADAVIAASDSSGNRSEINQARFESQCVSEVIEQQPSDSEEPFDGNNLGTFIVDITDPTAPKTVSFIQIRKGSHNQTVHPSGDYLYNSNSDLIVNSPLPQITIHDISDPEAPRFVQDFKYPPGQPALGEESHDIFFNGDGTRAYVASLGSTLILDTSNPEKPSIISQFVDPSNDLSHGADFVSLPREDGTLRDLLIVTDEQAGALPQSNCPGGGLHVYDITGDNAEDPLAHKQGIWFIPAMEPALGKTCTSHVLRIYPNQKMLTIAWYSQGVRVLDISGLAEFQGSPRAVAFGDGVGMKEIGNYVFEDSDTWSFKTNRIEADGSFFGYGNDIERGFDVYRFNGAEAELNVPVLEPEDLAADDLCSGVPVASAYVDRAEARDVHERSIDCVIYRAIAQGVVKDQNWFYEPLLDVTREQMATFVVATMRAAGVDAEFPEAPAEDKFDDIGESVHRENINLLAEAGIITGTGDGKYSPNEPISRQQMATFMVNAANYALGDSDLAPGAENFDDVGPNNTHVESIGSGAFAGLFSGVSETRFAPTKNVQRDQMASFLTNLLNVTGDSQSGIPGRQ